MELNRAIDDTPSASRPDFLLESLDGLLQSSQLVQSVAGNIHRLTAPPAHERAIFLKFRDWFTRFVATLWTRHCERSFVVPTSLDLHDPSPGAIIYNSDS